MKIIKKLQNILNIKPQGEFRGKSDSRIDLRRHIYVPKNVPKNVPNFEDFRTFVEFSLKMTQKS